MNLLYLPFTVLVFLAAVELHKRVSHPLLNPVLITLTVLVAVLLGAGIPYSEYNQGGHWLSDLLQPAVVALGVPLYTQMSALRRELPAMCLTVLLASALAIVSTLVLALLVGASDPVAASLAPKSVTTPIAVLISEQVGGNAALAAIAVIITGLVGAIFGVAWLNRLGIRSAKAKGIAMGTACHALGTARIAEEGGEEGAYSALALVLSAAFSALLAPILVPWLLGLG